MEVAGMEDATLEDTEMEIAALADAKDRATEYRPAQLAAIPRLASQVHRRNRAALSILPGRDNPKRSARRARLFDLSYSASRRLLGDDWGVPNPSL
jgi:hypothetical protein